MNKTHQKYVLAVLCVLQSVLITVAQVTERKRPQEWNNLVEGGRFMDLFLPIPPNGNLTSDTWGGDNVIPRYVDNGIEDREWSYWGGNAKLGDDGKYHLFVCRWKESSPKGHHEWSNSIVVHAIAENSAGPYKVKSTVGPGHNPEIFRMKDGRYVIYVIDGYYISENLDGPWTHGKFEFDPRDRKIIEGLSNLTFAQREDGSFLMICRGGGVWFSETGISPYYQVTDKRVYPPVEGRFEDPLVWRDNIQYHLIVNDWFGRIAWYLRSKDGINWIVDPGEAYQPGIARYEDGTVENWFKYERIKVLQDKYGRATQAHFAVIDTLKNEDKANDRHSSKHIIIPLLVGKLLTVLNDEKISENTKLIRVKIEAESDFNLEKDVDWNTVRFGAPELVDFGKGSKLLKTEKSGDDLILEFDGSESGINEKCFAAKLLGKTKSGTLIYGYSRLPGVDYMEPSLSARLPVFTKNRDGYSVLVEVQNFGQVESKPAEIKINIVTDGLPVELVSGKIAGLKPFQKTNLKLTCKENFKPGERYLFTILADGEHQKAVLFQGEAIPNP